MKATPQKNTLLKNAQGNAASNFFKRVFFSPTQRRIFSTPLFFVFFPPPHGQTASTTSCASNVNCFGQVSSNLTRHSFGQTEARTDNSGFKKLAVQWLIEVQFSNQTFVQVDSFVLRNRQLLKPAKR